MKKIIALVLIFLSASIGFGSNLQLPHGMSPTDSKSALSILGPGSSPRMLSSPFPLGGFQGLEVGLAKSWIPAEDLSHLGQADGSQESFAFPVVTLGKGFYRDMDLFVGFIPFGQSDLVKHFDAQLRQVIYRHQKDPILVSVMVNWGLTNIENAVSLQSYGADLVASFYHEELSLYAGLGTLYSSGRFLGGAQGLTISHETEVYSEIDNHFVAGLDLHYAHYFFAFELDQYERSFFSGKIGYRF